MVELVAREQTVTVWGKIIVRVRKDDLVPLGEDFYDEKGNLMRRMTFSDVRTFDGRTIPSTLEMVPLSKEGHKTTVRYVEAQFDRKLDGDVFSLRNLRRRR